MGQTGNQSGTRPIKQAVAKAYGEPADVVTVIETDAPTPGPGQVAVAVRAAGVNPIDAKTIRGVMGADEAKLPLHPGFEVAGVVSAVGDGVTEPGIGDEVIVYRADGGFAETVIAEPTAVHPKPAGLDFETAAGLLLVGVTAADAVATAGIDRDSVVLIHGGAGAVGAIAVQLAVRAGATVLATASPANHDYLRGLGAIPIAYGDGLLDRVLAAAPSPVTASIDTVGTDEAIDTSLALHPADRIVSIAAFGRADDGITIVSGATPQSRQNRTDAIDGLISAAADGTLVLEVAKTFPLTEAATALTELTRAHPRGKFVLIP